MASPRAPAISLDLGEEAQPSLTDATASSRARLSFDRSTAATLDGTGFSGMKPVSIQRPICCIFVATHSSSRFGPFPLLEFQITISGCPRIVWTRGVVGVFAG